MSCAAASSSLGLSVRLLTVFAAAAAARQPATLVRMSTADVMFVGYLARGAFAPPSEPIRAQSAYRSERQVPLSYP